MNKIVTFIIILLFAVSCTNKEEIVEYYPNGSIKAKYITINDSINGDYITYFESGEIKTIIQYKNNIKNGVYKAFYKNGQLQKIFNIENGIREGLYLYYDSLGNLEGKGKIINDKFYSFYKVYYPKGNLKTIKLMFNDNEVYSLSYDSDGNEITKSENYVDLIAKDTVNLGEIYEAQFIIKNNNFEKIYFIEGTIDTSVYYSISDTLKIYNQINDSVVIFKTKALKRGRNYWTGIFYGVQKDSDTTLFYPDPIREQFYVK